MYKYIYGPVASRRLGISLGVDLVPFKYCSFNCVYCECGRNTKTTLERKEYLPADDILDEIRDYMKKGTVPDHITLSGSGEPMLSSKAGYVISTVKKEFPDVKLAVLTNGSLLYLSDVRKELMDADIVLPSLDAAREKSFMRINRPICQLTLNQIIKGIAIFTADFKALSPEKKVLLEVFIIENVNTDDENVDSIRDAIMKIKPDKVQLNTLDRPGAEKWVVPASKEAMESVVSRLGLNNAEIISRYKFRKEIRNFRKDIENEIIEIISRRPETAPNLSHSTGLEESELSKYLEVLEYDKKISTEIVDDGVSRGVFYRVHRA